MASTCPFAGWRSSGLRATLVALLTLGLGLSMARAASTGLDDGRCLLRQGQVRLAAEQLADRHAATPAGLARAQTAAALAQLPPGPVRTVSPWRCARRPARHSSGIASSGAGRRWAWRKPRSVSRSDSSSRC